MRFRCCTLRRARLGATEKFNVTNRINEQAMMIVPTLQDGTRLGCCYSCLYLDPAAYVCNAQSVATHMLVLTL